MEHPGSYGPDHPTAWRDRWKPHDRKRIRYGRRIPPPSKARTHLICERSLTEDLARFDASIARPWRTWRLTTAPPAPPPVQKSTW